MRLVLFFSVVLSFSSCSSNKTEVPSYEFTTKEMETGAKLIKENCSSCHYPSKSEFAPSWKSIKDTYSKNYPDTNKAITSMYNFLSAPNQNKPLLNDAVNKFGEMPILNYSPKEYKAVSMFIINQQITEENSLKEALNKYQSTNEVNYLQKGKSIAMQTKGILGSNLKNAIMKNGTDSALIFCNAEAFNLTDSMSDVLNSSIKRVSDQPRNPNNLANEQELSIINKYKKQLISGEEVTGFIKEDENNITGYYPIFTNKMCMQCHGEPNKQIKPSTLSLINNLYPNDKATGYGINQLRGIWVINLKQRGN